MIRHAKTLRVSIEYQPPGEDALGQNVAPWQALCSVWAYRYALRGREFTAGDAQQAETVIMWQVAARADVTVGMRVRWGNTLHQITAVVPNGKDMDLQTRDGVPA